MKTKAYVTVLLGLIMLMLLPVYGIQKYTDLPKAHWAYSYVEDMSEEGIISGYPDGSFQPDREVSLGEFIKLMYVSRTGKTLDLAGTHWALNYYYGALELGLFTEEDLKSSQLDDVITRKDMALMTGNVLIANGCSGSTDKRRVISEVPDLYDYTEHIYEIAVSYDAGVLNGYTDGYFRPYNGLTRAEAVKVIARLREAVPEKSEDEARLIGIEKLENRDIFVTKYEVFPRYRGIKKIIYNRDTGLIEVYSDRIQDISLFSDGYMNAQIMNEDGEYWKKDGCYVYMFFSEKNYTQKTKYGISFGNFIEEIYYYSLG